MKVFPFLLLLVFVASCASPGSQEDSPPPTPEASDDAVTSWSCDRLYGRHTFACNAMEVVDQDLQVTFEDPEPAVDPVILTQRIYLALHPIKTDLAQFIDVRVEVQMPNRAGDHPKLLLSQLDLQQGLAPFEDQRLMKLLDLLPEQPTGASPFFPLSMMNMLVATPILGEGHNQQYFGIDVTRVFASWMEDLDTEGQSKLTPVFLEVARQLRSMQGEHDWKSQVADYLESLSED